MLHALGGAPARPAVVFRIGALPVEQGDAQRVIIDLTRPTSHGG